MGNLSEMQKGVPRCSHYFVKPLYVKFSHHQNNVLLTLVSVVSVVPLERFRPQIQHTLEYFQSPPHLERYLYIFYKLLK